MIVGVGADENPRGCTSPHRQHFGFLEAPTLSAQRYRNPKRRFRRETRKGTSEAREELRRATWSS